MKLLQSNEIYDHLSGFLKSRGIQLTDGSYSGVIQKSCSFLTDAINLSQRGLDKAKVEVDAKLDQMRQVIHEKTAPTNPPKPAPKVAVRPAAAPRPKAAAKRATTRRNRAPSKPARRKTGRK